MARRRAGREPRSMTPSRMMTRQSTACGTTATSSAITRTGRTAPAAGACTSTRSPEAFAVAAVCLVLFLICNCAVIATAHARAAVARGLLGPAEDPLREAKEVLGRPGPLSSNLRA